MRVTTDRAGHDGNVIGLMDNLHYTSFTNNNSGRFHPQSNTFLKDSNDTSNRPSDTTRVAFSHRTPNMWEGNIRDRMKNIAGYGSMPQNSANNGADNIAGYGSTQNSVNNGADNIVRGVLLKLGNFIQQCV